MFRRYLSAGTGVRCERYGFVYVTKTIETVSKLRQLYGIKVLHPIEDWNNGEAELFEEKRKSFNKTAVCAGQWEDASWNLWKMGCFLEKIMGVDCCSSI